MTLFITGCGESKSIKLAKAACENELKYEKNRIETVMNLARIAGRNTPFIFFDMEYLDMGVNCYDSETREFYEDIRTIHRYIMGNEEDVEKASRLLETARIKDITIFKLAQLLKNSDIVLAEKMTLKNCKWWDLEIFGKNYVAAGEKNKGYVLFEVDGDKVNYAGYCFRDTEKNDGCYHKVEGDKVGPGTAFWGMSIFALNDGELIQEYNGKRD